MSTAAERQQSPTREDEPRFGPASNGILMTPEEFDRTPEWEWDEAYRYELINGVLVVTPIPAEAETDPNGELEYLLRRYRYEHPQGSALVCTVVERHVRTLVSRRRADRVIWAGLGRQPDPKTDVPTIVVEFVSARKRDRERDYNEKRRAYLEIGVREHWVIDRFQRRMVVDRADAEDLIIAADGTYHTELLPGFELPLGRLLALSDRWKGDE